MVCAIFSYTWYKSFLAFIQDQSGTGKYGTNPDFSDDDDELFEELTNRALQVEAIQNKSGSLKIHVKVDPKVELETMVMTIPSAQKNIGLIFL